MLPVATLANATARAASLFSRAFGAGLSRSRSARRLHTKAGDPVQTAPLPSPAANLGAPTVRGAALGFVLALGVLGLGVATVGCFSYRLSEPKTLPIQPFYPSPEGLAQICVIRASGVAVAVTFVVRDNGELVGATRGPTFFCYHAAPGRHRLVSESEDDTETITFDIPAGERRYLHQGVSNVFGFVKSDSSWVSEDEAKSLVDQSAYAILVGVPKDQRLPAPRPLAPAVPVASAPAF